MDSCEISRAGMVHDIGKLQIGKYLYGRQTDILKIEEMKYIRMHPELGFMELKNRADFRTLFSAQSAIIMKTMTARDIREI